MTSESENPGELTGGNTIENPPEYLNPPESQKRGALVRPNSIYDRDKIMKIVCNRVASSNASLATICSAPNMPDVSEISEWLRADESYIEMYEDAKRRQADWLVEEMVEIADDSRNDWMEKHGRDAEGYRLNGEHISRTKLRIDTRKWCAAKLRPKKYGERSDVNITQEFSLSSLTLDQLQQRLEALRLSGHDPSTPVIEALASAGDETRDAEK